LRGTYFKIGILKPVNAKDQRMPTSQLVTRPNISRYFQLSFSLFFFLLTTSLMGQAPSSILPDIVNFKITFPLDENEDDYTGVDYDDRDDPHIKSEEEENLSGYSAPGMFEDYFYVDGNDVVFKAHCAGALTSINAYPRCELREMPGGTASFWDFADEQELNATFAVTNLPDEKKEVCMLQIKGSNTGSNSGTSEVLRVEYREGSQGLHLVINENTTLTYVIDYDLDDIMEAKLHVNNGEVTVDLENTTTGDTYNYVYDSDYTFGYFKAGCYTQSSIWHEKNGVADEEPTAYGEVRFSELTLGVICTPTPITNQFTTNVGETTATLNWDYDSEMDHYNARYRPIGTSTWDYKYSLHSGTVDIDQLIEDTEYEWQVRAKCPDGTATNYVDGAGPNFVTLSSVVPVEFINFTADYDERQNQVSLLWETASEINNQGFYIERASESTDDFEVLGWVEGNGNAIAVNRYSFYDSSINTNQNYYYRVQQVDFDGAIDYSNIVAVGTGRSTIQWKAFPNPMDAFVTISSGHLIDKDAIIQLVDINGRIVFKATGEFSKGTSIDFHLGTLPSGIYVLVLTDKSGSILFKERLIKK